jgi:hypothetical protein
MVVYLIRSRAPDGAFKQGITVQTTPSTTPKSLKSLVGAAHHALRAYVKAFEARAQSQERFRYHVPHDGLTAAILDQAGATVMERPIADWANEGPQVRLSMIGLKCIKEEIETAAREAGQPARVRFDLDILDGRAWLEIDGKLLCKEDLDGFFECLKLTDRARILIPTLTADELQSIGGWARIGRQVEIDYFLALQAAEGYDVGDSMTELRNKGVRLGIIRRRKEQDAQAQ